MHFGINITNFGDYADPHAVMRLARATEESGWDGLFIWDHLAFVWGPETGEPWTLLAAAAVVTERIVLSTAVTPLPRRRPWVCANQIATLDSLSRGRVIFGAGIGARPREYTAFGESSDDRLKAAKLDEGLEVVESLLRGGAVTYHGEHYITEDVTMPRLSGQRERVPIWIGGNSRPALRRAARWDGWLADTASQQGMRVSPDELAGDVAYLRSHRTGNGPFDVGVIGYTEPGDSDLPRRYAEAGATWWQESLHGIRGTYDEMMARVVAGPPPS